MESQEVSRAFHVGGCEISFPHTPYSSQLAMMDKIIFALRNKKNVLLELPTGSGKSLSLLCAISSWLQVAEREMQQGFLRPDESEDVNDPDDPH
eukprot:145853-Hanusia_phi.AAC.1